MNDSSGLLDFIRTDADTQRQVIDHHADVSLLCELTWQCENARHTDFRYQQGLNLWQDFFPPQLESALAGSSAGDRVKIEFKPGELSPATTDSNCFKLDAACFKTPAYRNLPVTPCQGRFYPRGFIAGAQDIHVTFSNRWFPPEVVRIWELLHEYEPMGLVLEYFFLSGLFTDLRSCAVRGLPRPGDNGYADRLATWNPVYAVCGARLVS